MERVETLPSRAWSAASLATGAQQCAQMSGCPLDKELTREELLKRLQDCSCV